MLTLCRVVQASRSRGPEIAACGLDRTLGLARFSGERSGFIDLTRMIVVEGGLTF
jgi:hypothetical protein